MNLAEITPRLALQRSKVKQYLIRIDRTIVEQLEPGCKLKVDIKKNERKNSYILIFCNPTFSEIVNKMLQYDK